MLVHLCVCVAARPVNSACKGRIFVVSLSCLCLSDLRNNALQLGDSRFVPLECVRYTRDQLLEMREVLIRSYSVYLAVYFIT
jgi:hypothetical protein